MIRRPPRSTLFPLHDALPISGRIEVSPAVANKLLDGADSLPPFDNKEFYSPDLQKLVRSHVREACPDGFDELVRSEEHTSELQSQSNLVCRLLLEKQKKHIEH